MKTKSESRIFLLIIFLIIVISVWSAVSRWSGADPNIEQKYDTAAKDLRRLKSAVITFYCREGRFPSALDDLVPGIIEHLPKDPWGHKYIITSLAWRVKGSGMDLLSKGGDGKRGGKAWKADIIARIDLKEIRCEKRKRDTLNGT